MGKTTFLIGAAAGYVLGSRAGRERYEQIVQTARRLWENPTVQQKVGDVEELASETARSKGPVLQDKVKGLVDTAKSKVPGGHGGETSEPSPSYETTTASTTTTYGGTTSTSPTFEATQTSYGTPTDQPGEQSR